MDSSAFNVIVSFVLAQLLLLGLGLITFAFWLWMLIECLRRKDMTDGQKVSWVLVIVLVSCVGAAIYFLFGERRNRRYT